LSAQVAQPQDLPGAISSAPTAHAWLVDDYPMFNAHRSQIIELIEAQRKPAMYSSVSWMRDGGLLAYSADALDIWRRAAGFVDRVLRGAKPGDMPVEEPVRYLLGVNLAAARRLGIAIARDVLLQADELVQ
jgi:putative ABC transport system substrate-binding protein